jgi:Tol biopolymer transport system component
MTRFLLSLNLLSILTINGIGQAHDEAPSHNSHYLEQPRPGLIPKVFAPGIVSNDGRSEAAVSFSPDLDEVYFQAGGENEKLAIYFSQLEGKKWTPIEKAAFTDGKKDEEVHPFVSHDGKRIYFTAYSSDLFDTGVWYVDRSDWPWSDARKLGLPINDDKAFGFNQAKSGNVYYFNISKRKNSYATFDNNGSLDVTEFEIEPGVYHVFTSPNEDYFVAYGPNNEEGREDSDIYASFKTQDGTWGTPINLGSDVNSKAGESVPTISPDGKYLFFGREEDDGTENIYWVSTEVIERLRP